MQVGKFYLVEGINPVPWTAPSFSVRGGKPTAYKSEELRAYQEAFAEEFKAQNPEAPYIEDTPMELAFCFWRRLDSYELGDGQKSSDHRADATNLQKSTEDALQGVLFKNDRDVQAVSSKIIAQGPSIEPAVLVWINHGPFVVAGYAGSMNDMRSTLRTHREAAKFHVETGGQQSRIKKWDVTGTF